jgi:hypothetical protein
MIYKKIFMKNTSFSQEANTQESQRFVIRPIHKDDISLHTSLCNAHENLQTFTHNNVHSKEDVLKVIQNLHNVIKSLYKKYHKIK